jgi:hypothetical protein
MDPLTVGHSGNSMSFPDTTTHGIGRLGEDLYKRFGQRVGSWKGFREQGGYPLDGGSAWGLAKGFEAPIGHTQVGHVLQAPAPNPYGAGGHLSPGIVPALYAGNPDLTNGG